MTLSPKLKMTLCLTFALAACGSDASDLAFADDVDSEGDELVASETPSTPQGELVTTTAPSAETCQGDRYKITLPSDWSHLDCEGISPVALYDPNNPPETEWANEIDARYSHTLSGFSAILATVQIDEAAA